MGEKRADRPDSAAAARRRAEGRLLAKVERTIARHGLLRPGDKVLVAYSGGADSTALLTLLVRLRDKYALRLAMAHFNHLLRASAAEDERFAAEQAQRLGLPLYLGREDVRAYAGEKGLNLEEAGRERRYEFLRTRAAKIGANRIATGHTLTDQAETVILRLLRGAGPAGLAGISPSLDGLVIRPLLDVEHGELEAYLKEQGIAWREDETNRDRRFLRNRVRLELIPCLARDFEPAVVRRLARLAEICREDEAFLKTLDRDAERAPAGPEGGGGAGEALDAVELGRLPVAAGRRRVREFLRALRGDLRRISFSDIEAVRRLGERKELDLPGGLTLGREGGLIRRAEKRRSVKRLSFSYAWDGGGPLAIEETGARFTAKTVPRAAAGALIHDDEGLAQIDADRVTLPLLVRPRREGDRYRPLGAPGRKKLKEIMRARDVPLEERGRRPVFLSAGEIVWVPGLPVAEDFKVTPATARVLVIRKLRAPAAA